MSSTGTENYSRIIVTLMKGGTKLTRRLVEKTVKDLSKNGGENTIDEFLLKNKSLLLKRKLGENNQDVFFPPSGHTNLDNWDLGMLCFILEETCGLTNIMKMYIKKLLKIRNKLCHSKDPTLETRKFEEYTEQMKCSFEHCLKEINDDEFTEEINALVQSLATGPLSLFDLLEAVHQRYFKEMTNKEVLEKIKNDHDLTIGKLDTLLEKIERLDSRLPSGAFVDNPGTENYSRTMLTLMRGGTKLTRRLVEKTVRDHSKNGEEDTIDDFLLKNKSLLSKQKLGKIKHDVFFPPSGHTNLDNWDLCMFCFILEETCDLSYTTKMRIKKLLKIRNKLCHLNDPTLEKIKFEEYTEQMKCSFEYCLKEINDDEFTEEINALVQSLTTRLHVHIIEVK
ncbi:uncharacterized protein LOC132752684 [Ruditapes philippinarum]|uniref:uncharacterized protein LOC132752684 n=1 Tax=Ruditapes philippinarum TaxID=129788 RepID=UPI00295B2F43|nr:uncharacterized protein LOC132752684 [Ruditapes philippinarum]